MKEDKTLVCKECGKEFVFSLTTRHNIYISLLQQEFLPRNTDIF